MKYLIYKTTNLVNGKIYIGCHKTDDINDDYMGSGKILKRAINKYGIDNFKKEILQIFDNSEDMFVMESIIVNEEFIKDKSNYNLKLGGEGGFDYINNNGLSSMDHLHNDPRSKKWRKLGGKNAAKHRNDVIKEKRKDPEYDKWYRSKQSRSGKQNGMFGKIVSNDTKKVLSEKSSGKNNSQYGTHIYCDKEGIITKRFKEGYQPEGWVTTIEYKRSKMKRKTTFNKHWYNDGTKSFLRFEEDAQDLIRGRLPLI